MSGATVTVVTVAYGAEPWLERSVHASLASNDVVVDVVLVDNGCTDGAVERLATLPAVTVVRPVANLGFAAGNNVAAQQATGEYLALVNPDAIVAPDALARLVEVASRADVGIATASVRLADRDELLNSAGLALHFLGVSWAGHFEEPAIRFDREQDVAAGSGAGMVMRADRWRELGGFCPEFFAYYEDCELGVRTWQHGWRVVYVPGAVIAHRYEFGRNSNKHFLVERNRLIMVLSCWSGRTLALLAPVFVLAELAVLCLAVQQGWAGNKLRSWWWLVRHARWIARRRAVVQAARLVSDAALVPVIERRLEPANYPLPSLAHLQAPLSLWWRVVSRFV